jgi:hypothetical protein
VIKNTAPELAGLQGIKLNRAKQVKDGTSISFSNAKAVKVLVGYFVDKDNAYLQPLNWKPMPPPTIMGNPTLR